MDRASPPFQNWEIRALLDGRKTQTRRLIKPQPTYRSDVPTKFIWRVERGGAVFNFDDEQLRRYAHIFVPWKIGDRLWVREAWAKDDMILDGTRYYATDDVHPLRRKRPSIHMPRWASRLTLTVTDVRVQRLHDISGKDCFAEGVDVKAWRGPNVAFEQWAVNEFSKLWDDIHGAGAWDANPWVSATTFTVERKNIG